MAARHAIYLAPPADGALWRFGSQVLGYDAATGEILEGFSLPGVEAPRWREMTARPRQYGFHATLKAPFRLREEASRAEFVEAVDQLAAEIDTFDLGPLSVRSIGGDGKGFAALTQVTPSAALSALEERVVKELDRFRAPLTDAELAHRRPERLSERQRAALYRWSYPHIGPDYLFHMTLSGETTEVDDIADALALELAQDVGGAHFEVSELVLFEQPSAGANFRITHRAPLRQSAWAE